MNLDSETTALSQIQYLVTSLSKKNYQSSVSQCLQLVEQFGSECERHLYKSLFNFTDISVKQNSFQLQFLAQCCESLFDHPNFVSLLCFCFKKSTHKGGLSFEYLSHVCKALKLSPIRTVAFACALRRSDNQKLKSAAEELLVGSLRSLLDNLETTTSKADFLDLNCSPSLIQFVLSEVIFHKEIYTTLIRHLKGHFSDQVPVALLPFISNSEGEKELEVSVSEELTSQDILSTLERLSDLTQGPSLLELTLSVNNSSSASHTNMAAILKAHLDSTVPDMVRELGYQFTSSHEACRNHMRTLITAAGGSDMHAATVARIIGVMVRTHTGLDDSASLQSMNATGTSLWEKDKQADLKTWNIDVFIKVVHEMQPTLHWKEIVYELDHPGFAIKDRQGLKLLLKALKLGFQLQGFSGLFPVDMFYRPWKNSDGQVTFFQQALRNPDVFNFAEHQYHPVAVEVLKVQPDLEKCDLAAWRCLEVIDTLLVLAEAGHSHAVKEMFSVPQSNCPDVLTLGLMQINPPLTNFRTELLIQNLQLFLGPHPNSAVILTHAWHSSTFNLKVVVIHAMAEWYSKAVQEGDSEHSRLSRILDVAQDLKALSVLLSAKPGPFVIDLAVLASRREYLNLDKWLNDQMRENGEQFVKTVINYLQRKLPNIHGPGPLKEEHIQKVNFHVESLAAILVCLQSVATSAPIHNDLKEHILNMCQNSAALLSKPRPQPSLQPQVLPPAGNVRPNRPPGSIGDPPSFRQSYLQQSGTAAIDPLVSLASQMSIGGNTGGFGMSSPLGQIVSGANTSVLAQQPSSPSRMFSGGPSSAFDAGRTSSPFNPALTAPSQPVGGTPSSSASLLHIDQIRQGLTNISSLFPEISGPLAREVEDEANSYFQRIYNHPPYPTLTIDEVLELLKDFQESNKPRERDVFNCMIKNLFEEYKYFPQYPEKELHITAQLFGGIIEHGLVCMIPLGLALRFVLDAVRKPPESKMYYFGVAALDRFKTKLKDYPQYCQHVSCISHFKEFPTHLIEWVEFGTQSQTPPNKPQGPVLPPHLEAHIKGSSQTVSSTASALPPTTVAKPSVTSSSSAIVRPIPTTSRPSIANTTNIDTLLNARQKMGIVDNPSAPSDKVQDKVAFIFNNLSLMNMQQKSDDLIETLQSDGQEANSFSAWLAQYLVLKRASIEPNFHNLYASFLEVLRNEVLYSDVLKETFSNIRILLTSDKSIANFSDRSLLKNLGHWLGLMTLARNKPILMVDLDIKPLIVEAHQIGQQELMYVVPFVAKVLESCAKSKVFKPPSPWTMGIMNLLAELHQEHDLKLNLKFEIEVLCKALSIELASLQPSNMLSQMVNIRSFGLKSQTPVSSQMSGASKTDSFSMVQGHLGQKASLQPPHMTTSVDQMQMGMSSSNLHGFTTGTLATSNAPGKGLGGALMQAPTQSSVQSGFITSSQPRMSLVQGPTDVATSVTGFGGLEQSSLSMVASAQSGLLRPLEPKFHYADINTSNLNAIVPHIVIDPRLNLLKEQPEFAQFIKLAIEKSIHDVAPPVIDRAVKIALTTCEQLIKKDFALDHDENRMRQAAHHMVRNLTAGMAMITCKDHLHLAIKNHLKNFIVTLGRNMTTPQQESIDNTVTVIADDNVELACAFIQKKGIEKATQEIDKRLKSEYESRILAQKEGRAYCDAVTLTYQTERMPEPIRLKVGIVTSQQNAVYDEFARNIPGFKPLSEREVTAIAPKPLISDAAVAAPVVSRALTTALDASRQLVASEDCLAILEEVQLKIEPFVQSCNTLPATPHTAHLHTLVDALTLVRTNKDVGSVLLLIQKAVIALLEGLTPHSQIDTESLARYRDANLLVLRALADSRAFGSNWTSLRVTACLTEARDEIKYNLDAVDVLIRSGHINLFEYDKHLAQAMSNGENSVATTFAMHLCKIYLIDDRSNAHIIESDLFGTIEVLQRICSQSQRPPDGILSLMEMIKMSSERLEQNLAMSGPTAQLHSGIAQAREYEDPPGLVEKTEFLLREWVNAYHSRDAGKDSRQAFIVFVQLMNQHGILKTDDLITRFFRMATQMCVDLCYRALGEQNNAPALVRAKCFHTLDAYVRLITLLVKHSGETQNTITKVNLLNKVLGIVAGVLLIDHDLRQTSFQQVPYHRIFIMLFLELCSPDPILENISFQVLTAYCNMLHILRPAKATGFAFAWLEIVSHRLFLGRILAQTPGQKGWPLYAQLLIDLFKFMSPFLRNAELAKPVHRLYRGTLRVLLVLLHDFPEFLCDYHYGFCDVIPPNCIQLRNLILSAFPRNMRLPDPFTPNLKVELLSEISIAPRTVSNYAALINPSFKKDLDSYLKNRSPVAFLSELRSNLLMSSTGLADISPGNRYNIQLINALVMYVGTSAIQYIRSKGLTPSMSTIAHSSHMDIFQNLAVDLETEGRYLFLNCIANQLRYPNSHTHYFSCTLLYLFAEANQEAIQEQITRVLLERLIVNRPHPWGLLITFIELIKNPTYNFWKHEFVHCAPEIQKLFDSVARSCMVPSVPRLEVDGQLE